MIVFLRQVREHTESHDGQVELAAKVGGFVHDEAEFSVAPELHKEIDAVRALTPLDASLSYPPKSLNFTLSHAPLGRALLDTLIP